MLVCKGAGPAAPGLAHGVAVDGDHSRLEGLLLPVAHTLLLWNLDDDPPQPWFGKVRLLRGSLRV